MSHASVNLKISVRVLLAAIFLLCATSAALAQRTPAGPPAGAGPPPNNNPNLQDRFRQVDESKLRGAELDVGTEEEKQKRLNAAISNMKEDFTRIQVLRNDIARNLVARKPLDYKLVSEQTAEINKRASRLNDYMRARVPEGEKENNLPEGKSENMIGDLVRLCKLIDSFTENPALKNAATIDSKEIAKAKENKASADRDLLAIIKLSAGLRKRSDSLKTSQ
jgi:hypothetical protein